MITVIVLAYHIAIVCLAYFLGRNSAGRGVAVFFAGVIAFQFFVNGPASFIEPSGCDYGHAIQTC